MYIVKLPNLDPWINQYNSNENEKHRTTKTINKFENHLLSIKAEHQTRIRPNLHPTYNERHEKNYKKVKKIQFYFKFLI